MRGGRYPLGFPPRKLQPIAKAAGGEGGVAKRHKYKSGRLWPLARLPACYQ